ncbi:MAG: IclR family transcriptional regulator [Bacillota bacterium]|nr:IclR family transcriptional regulator [Bacillota bacterium]
MSLERGLDILEYLAFNGTPSSLDHLSETLEIPRTSCFRILKSLESKGYVQLAERIGREQQWELTYKLSIFADLVERETSLRTVARPFMKALAESTDLFVQLGIISNNQVLYIDDVKRPKLLRVYAPKWSHLEIHACAAGLVMASYMPQSKIEAIIRERGLAKLTSKTITDETEFYEKLRQVREQQYAIDHEYYATGIKCVAAPIFNYQEKCIAAVGVTGHCDEFADIDHVIREVQNCALNISKKMQYGNGVSVRR